ERMSDALAKIGIPVAHLSLETPDEFYRDVANAGIILGNGTRAGEITAFFRTRIERIQKTLAGLAEEKKPRILLVMATDRGGFGESERPCSCAWLPRSCSAVIPSPTSRRSPRSVTTRWPST
ncbi:MAG: hypothetical protein NTV82_18085, partial [Candidatus Aminicenantes bacterium]|nr:hypothetical protein [Candidatus Aminicenantes bacterium]